VTEEAKEPIKKGQILIVKVPPYYEKEYYYQVTMAGDKLIRADLYHSPKVKKNWTKQDLATLMEHGIVRLAMDHERPQGSAEVDKSE
jgi:predicted  nucleic acid-binding Zn ribbon protein